MSEYILHFVVIVRWTYKLIISGHCTPIFYTMFCSKAMGWAGVVDDLDSTCALERNGVRPLFMYCCESSPCLYKGKYSEITLYISASFK